MPWPKCGVVTVQREVLDAVAMMLAALVLRRASLKAAEVRYLAAGHRGII